MKDTYWGDKGKYQAESADLQKLVPGAGNCATFKGEVWRAATKIYYDYYNNGWGNTWQEPAAFLITHIDLPEDVIQVLFAHAAGNRSEGCDVEVELMIDSVIEQLRNLEDRPNIVDMWDFEADWELSRKFAAEYTEEDDSYIWNEHAYQRRVRNRFA
jgi:hypothetical protein